MFLQITEVKDILDTAATEVTKVGILLGIIALFIVVGVIAFKVITKELKKKDNQIKELIEQKDALQEERIKDLKRLSQTSFELTEKNNLTMDRLLSQLNILYNISRIDQ